MLTIIVRVGRATTVPFTAVLAGLQQTISYSATGLPAAPHSANRSTLPVGSRSTTPE
jgi:hypothetical protein